MQYSIYVVLGLCLACLVASLAVFCTLERRWRDKLRHDAREVLARRPRVVASSMASMSPMSPRQWEALRHRLQEMQILAEEGGRPGA